MATDLRTSATEPPVQFSKERTKVTKDFPLLILPRAARGKRQVGSLRALRDLRGELSVTDLVAALPLCDLRGKPSGSTLVAA